MMPVEFRVLSSELGVGSLKDNAQLPTPNSQLVF